MTPTDWYLLEFYRRVSGQYINQSPMGAGGSGPILTIRLEAVEAALRAFQYPEEDWGWLSAGVLDFHELVYNPPDNTRWIEMIGKRRHEIRPWDVLADGDT